MSTLRTKVVVVGGGPAGLTAAVALARAGIETVLVAGSRPGDNRATALLAGSVVTLEDLGVWPECQASASPLAAIRIVDDRGGLVRAPEVMFRAEEIGLDAFGQNIENTALSAALLRCASALPALTVIEASVAAVDVGDASASVRLADGRVIDAELIVGADGRNSFCRAAAGIEVDRWSYPQAAVSCTLAHTRPHGAISTEFHTRTGPFTLVPLSDQRSSLVWVVEPEAAEELRALDDAAFAYAVERQAHSILGKMKLIGIRAIFPLQAQSARRLAASRIALVGEAAHVLPPIGAQGFNLGLRDAVAVAELAAEAALSGDDLGADKLTARYNEIRRGDVTTRTLAVDLLNRSLLTDFLPVQGLRGLGLSLLKRIGPLRRAVMREGVAGAGPRSAI